MGDAQAERKVRAAIGIADGEPHRRPGQGGSFETVDTARQSAFSTFGSDAAHILSLTGWMTLAGAVIFVSVMALLIHAIRAPEGQIGLNGAMRLVLWVGAVIPSILLAILLLVALPAMRPRETGPADLRIEVTGEQFWWQVRYAMPGGAPVVSANEVRLPVGQTVAIDVKAADVLHSFWIPGLAGKMDMIPGRTNRLVVRADKAGRYRGQCAEFCGLSHALMAFDVIAMEPAAFAAWRAREAAPAATPGGAGAALFARYGCGSCHTVRGTGNAGAIGPDLTHFGARATMAAGIMPTTRANVARFVRDPVAIKPGVRMPIAEDMNEADANAIADYLVALK